MAVDFPCALVSWAKNVYCHVAANRPVCCHVAATTAQLLVASLAPCRQLRPRMAAGPGRVDCLLACAFVSMAGECMQLGVTEISSGPEDPTLTQVYE